MLTAVLAGGLRAAVPLFLAALGEVFAERSGVLNLGLEGIMLTAALIAVLVTNHSGSPLWGLVAAIGVGVGLALCHGVICIWLHANQVASGIALIVFGTGLSALMGKSYVGSKVQGIGDWPVPYIKDLPVIGPLLFRHDPVVYFIYLLIPLTWFLLYRTRWGLEVRAVGEDPAAAAVTGVRVRWVRLTAVLLGGGLAGLAGAYLSIVYSQLWLENMVAGRGLIALALVVFASWDPVRVFFGAWLFGAVSALQLRLQAAGAEISPYLLSMLPYLLTIAVLVYATWRLPNRMAGVPRSLGLPYIATR
ncbi:MAG: ABC transporter permease [Methylotetracoccus sp.]